MSNLAEIHTTHNRRYGEQPSCLEQRSTAEFFQPTDPSRALVAPFACAAQSAIACPNPANQLHRHTPMDDQAAHRELWPTGFAVQWPALSQQPIRASNSLSAAANACAPTVSLRQPRDQGSSSPIGRAPSRAPCQPRRAQLTARYSRVTRVGKLDQKLGGPARSTGLVVRLLLVSHQGSA